MFNNLKFENFFYIIREEKDKKVSEETFILVSKLAINRENALFLAQRKDFLKFIF